MEFQVLIRNGEKAGLGKETCAALCGERPCDKGGDIGYESLYLFGSASETGELT